MTSYEERQLGKAQSAVDATTGAFVADPSIDVAARLTAELEAQGFHLSVESWLEPLADLIKEGRAVRLAADSESADDLLCPACKEPMELGVTGFVGPGTVEGPIGTVGQVVARFVCENVNCPDRESDLAPATPEQRIRMVTAADEGQHHREPIPGSGHKDNGGG